MISHKIFYYTLAALAITGCDKIPPQAYFNRGNPESLLEVSTEAMVFNLQGPEAMNDLVTMLVEQQPSSAEVFCSAEVQCDEAGSILDQFAVPYTLVAGNVSEVVLYYDDIMARDCEQRFMTNHVNPYNLNHPTFGCSIAANAVQMIGDRRQIVDPALLSLPPSDKPVQAVEYYMEPTKPDLDFEQLGVESIGSSN